MTLTFCSVQDLVRTLSETRRALKPGGKLVFVEHVRPEGRNTGLPFDRITPLGRGLGGVNVTRNPSPIDLTSAPP